MSENMAVAAMSPDMIREQLQNAVSLHQNKRYDEAIVICESVLAFAPDHVDAQTFLASSLRQSGRLADATALYDRMALGNPQRADFWFNRGNALTDNGRFADAVQSFEKSLAIEPNNAQVRTNLAIAHSRLGEQPEAEASYRAALVADPAYRIAMHNLGNLLADQGRTMEGVAFLRQTIALWPDLAEGHYNLGLALLRLGDFANGFKEYEWRWLTPDFLVKPGYKGVPLWQGEPLANKRLVVHAEQGIGDTIQFARLLGLLASLGGEVVFHVPQKLEKLLKTVPFPVRVSGMHGASDADYQIPLLSLPRLLKLSFGAIPSMPSHLSAEPSLVALWAERLSGSDRRKRIGLVWKGNPNSPAEKGRSLSSPEELAPFAALADTRLIALQKLEREDLEPADTASGWRVKGLSFTLEHPGPELDSGADAFVETAAVMQNMDLVVSVCTAPLHLAGSLGRPAIGLLRAVPDWRWLLGLEKTPWYPAMRLERQKPGESYAPVIARAAERAANMLTSS